ncbi:MAG TPA: NAD(P)/FAD-dependent oxidoreductase, partial [Candidatus Acidoferrales bacterium]|nr:NAD(P)/FAD-dependent oxidoreductase [Candidatus Acidoferrales bacterium]
MAETRRIVIIGSGFGGLGLAIRLKRAGVHSFTILEKAGSLGGTWRENTYPGAACDVPSMLYCFSFDQKTDWTRKWSSQAEIRTYMEDSAQRNGILPHIRFDVEVTGASFDESRGTWTVQTRAGEEFVADVLVTAVGQLHHPSIPRIAGVDEFAGKMFHSARWDHEYDLTGKRVAVIGNAASAIQFIPQIAKDVAELAIFQRSANWMIPRNDRAYSEAEKQRFANVPGLSRLYRSWLWCMHEGFLLPMIQRRPWATRLYTKAATDYLHQSIADPALRRALTPDYPIGGKRVLISDDYYQALNRTNVRVITTSIERISKDAVVTSDGVSHPVDAIIFATGFRTNPFLASMQIEGVGGHRLEEDWSHGAQAYYGLTVTGYPNFFMMYGPNTNL